MLSARQTAPTMQPARTASTPKHAVRPTITAGTAAPCVVSTVGLPVGWRPLTDEGKKDVAAAFNADTTPEADLVVLIGAAWYAAKKDNDAGAAWAGLIENGREFAGAKTSVSTLPKTFPPSMAFLEQERFDGFGTAGGARVVAPRCVRTGGVEWKPTWCVGVAKDAGITDVIGDLGSGKLAVIDAVTGTQVSSQEIDVADPGAVSVAIDAVAANFPGIKIFATGKWRQAGLHGLACTGTAELSLLSQEDEGKYAGLCTAMLMEKIYNLAPKSVVRVLESGGGSTQITTVVL